MKTKSKAKISTLKLTQLTSLKPAGMAKRFKNHFEQVQDMAYLLQCAVVVLVKNALSPLDYSDVTKEVICKLLLEGKVDELASVRHLCVYFEAFFTAEDWKKVVDRLFESHDEFLKITASTKKTTDNLHKILHCGPRQPKELMNIATVFKDANGKKHRFTFKDVDPCYTVEETTELLSILTTLTIFEKDGVRRFTELVRYTYQSTVPVYDAEAAEEKTEEKSEKTVPAADHPLQTPLKDTPKLTDLSNRKTEEKTAEPSDAPKNTQQDKPKDKKKNKKSKRGKKERKAFLTKEEMQRQREEKKLNQQVRKKQGKKKRSKKKKR